MNGPDLWRCLNPPRKRLHRLERGGVSQQRPGTFWTHHVSTQPARIVKLQQSQVNCSFLKLGIRCLVRRFCLKVHYTIVAGGIAAGHPSIVVEREKAQIPIRWQPPLDLSHLVLEMLVNYHVVLQNNHRLLGLDALFPQLLVGDSTTVRPHVPTMQLPELLLLTLS